ncbi:STM3941 family protein [Bradyrhizobium sp. CB3481]|uniref:STM3941 family protein n=1 Tax=Bradyrhizobium sp. CB3481 TaxID=3039158 RepID=UPI0024B1EF98|nr:STM3941 family protein [Bradyrhizobium sp. CB3481]WFU17511.1 hypothetical protein QA643_03910 [Bradyrhizobium sp. CB3481]
MNVSGLDPDQTLEYRPATTIVRLLPTGLLLIFLGLLILALVVDRDREPVWTYLGVGLCLTLGAGLSGFTLWRRWHHGKPVFTLSPDGIHYRIPFVKQVLIPWHEIQGVDTVDIEAGYWSILWSTESLRYNTFILRHVTVILLPQRFYQQHLHISSLLLRGPAWKANFIPKGDLVQMALHHEYVSVEPRALREAVEARWRAFREKPAAPMARTSVPSTMNPSAAKTAVSHPAPTSGVIAMGEDPKSMSWWEATKVIALLIGIAIVSANLAGLWQASAPTPESDARAQARTHQKAWQESIKKSREDSKRLEAEDKERRRQLDEDMRRAFGR